MTNHIEHTPGVTTFVSVGPHVRQIAQERIEGSRSAAEQGNRVREVHAENNLVVMYLSPVSARITTVVFSAASSRPATARAAQIAAPEEAPARIPSSRASRRACENASSSVTASTSS